MGAGRGGGGSKPLGETCSALSLSLSDVVGWNNTSLLLLHPPSFSLAVMPATPLFRAGAWSEVTYTEGARNDSGGQLFWPVQVRRDAALAPHQKSLNLTGIPPPCTCIWPMRRMTLKQHMYK